MDIFILAGYTVVYMSSVFKITTEQFEGPIELLLSLIKEHKLPINEISLAKITDDYLRIMTESQNQSYDEVTQFMTIAGTLILIKSKSLLPVLDLTDEEEENIADLERRLKLYEAYKEVGDQLVEQYKTTPLFGRSYVTKTAVFAPDKKVTPEGLVESLQGVLNEIQKFTKKDMPQQRVKAVMHLEEMVDNLIERVKRDMNVSFHEFTHGMRKSRNADISEHKSYMVVGFLAMLEMVRNGIIAVDQKDAYQDILINKN